MEKLSIKPEIYKKVSLKKLIVFSIWGVTESKEECTFERLVKECFETFPQSFGFYRYPYWPDSLKLDRALRELREPDGYITGSNETRFLLTIRGLDFAKAVARELRTPVIERKRRIDGRKEKKLLEGIKSSEEFKEFTRSGGRSTPSESGVRDLAHTTLETPREVVMEHLENLGKLATESGDEQLSSFIQRCKKTIINV